jgi:dTDP-4-dehydrorhamnose 3,5-epimerase
LKLLPTSIPEVIVIEPRVFGDKRGFFLESWHQKHFAEAGLNLRFVQDNHSRSALGVLRGIHYQLNNPQGKLVRVVAGRVFDIAVDLRRSSASFGKWVGVELSADNRQMLWVPPGFGHGFLTLEDGTEFLYKCTDFYDPDDEQCIRWDDPIIGIEWPVGDIVPALSWKDRAGVSLSNALVYP